MPAEGGRLPGGAVPLGGAVDLGERKISDEQVAAAQLQAEIKAGLRCYGCKRRIRIGFEFVRFAPAEQGTAVVMQTMRAFACVNEDCDFAEKAAKDCVAVRPVEWAYPDDPMPAEQPVEPAGVRSFSGFRVCSGCGSRTPLEEVPDDDAGWREVDGTWRGPCCPPSE